MSFRDNTTPTLGFLLHEAARLLRRNLMRRIAPLGLTDAQARILFYLARNEGINQTCLADLLEVQPITLGRGIDRLEEMGLVERRPDPTDRRAVRLYLTDPAGPVLDEVWQHATAAREQAVAGLSEAERAALIAALSHLKDNLSAADPAVCRKDHAKHA